jgi:hypothetical protein
VQATPDYFRDGYYTGFLDMSICFLPEKMYSFQANECGRSIRQFYTANRYGNSMRPIDKVNQYVRSIEPIRKADQVEPAGIAFHFRSTS